MRYSDSIIVKWLEQKTKEIHEEEVKESNRYNGLFCDECKTWCTPTSCKSPKSNESKSQKKPEGECKEYVDTCRHNSYNLEWKYCPFCGEEIIDGTKGKET